MKNVLIQIGRTALLCGTLGCALYLALSYAAEIPAFASGLACAMAFALVSVIASSIHHALRNRVIPMKIWSISRDEQPVQYWAFLGFEIACGMASIAIAILSIARFVEAVGNASAAGQG